MARALFVCTQNRLRSPTAEQVFSQWPGVECYFATRHPAQASALHQRPNPSIEGTSTIKLRLLAAARHVKR